MDRASGSGDISTADIRRAFDEGDDPGAPRTAAEVADELDCPTAVAADELEALAERGSLKGKQIGSDSRVWWQDREQRERPRTTAEAEQEEEFGAFVEAVTDYAIFMLDPEGHIRTWNEGAERIKGYDEGEIVGEHLSTFYPDDAAADPDTLLETAAAEGSVEDEGWRVRADGERFWARVTITALSDEDGELRGFAKITRDLTERHEREKALERKHELTEQFRLLVESVEEYAIFITDTEGYIQSWNDGAEAIKGYSADEIVGEHISVFYTDEAIEDGDAQENLETARTSGHVEDEGWRLRADGERFWANVTITAIRDDDGELQGFAKVTRDMTERHEYEERLRQEKERFQRIVDEVRDYAIFRLDPEGHIQTWNEGAERIKGYDEGEIVGEHLSTFYPDDATAAAEELLARAAAQGRVAAEDWRLRKDGSRFWASAVLTAIYDEDGDLDGFAKITRDLTERKRREDRLAALDELGRSLLDAETPQVVSETVTEAAEAGLDLPISVIALYDDESGSLRSTSRTSRAEGFQPDVPFLNPSTDVPWEGFGNDEPLVVDELSHRGAGSTTDHPVTSGAIVPLGSHGVFITGYTDADEPSKEEVDFAKIVAADVEAALNNTERQELLREREAALAEQNESLERLNRINDVIRTIDQSLVDATSRTEIEQAVCNELATAGPYRFAWIGRQASGTDSITPKTWAGIETDYLDALDLSANDGPTENHPASMAARSRDPIALEDVRSDPPFEPWRKEALKRGFRSMICVPFLYEDSLYGVLTVQADEPGTFTGMERQVIEELGETVAHAINALERKRALVSDDVVELEFTVHDPALPTLQLVDHADCTFELDSVLSREDGSLTIFFTTRDGTPAEIDAFVEQSLAFTDLRHIGDEADGDVFEATVTEGSLVATLLDHGAVPETIVAEDGEGRVVVDLPSRADVREFVEMLQEKYPASELVARRTRDRAARTPQGFKAAFEDRITDRQREVLQTAYFSGFFDSPRKSTGEEIGDALDVSQPTVTHHLRAAQRELLGLLYDAVHPPVLDR